MAFKWFKKDTFSKLGDLVKQYGYPIALRNKLKDTFMPQQEDDKQTGLRQPITDEGFTITPPVGVDKTKSLEENVKGMQPLTVEEKPTIAPQTSNDVSGIKTILQTQQGAKEWNKKVQKDYLDFLNYATKFGEQGKPYMELAGLYAKGSMKDIPQLQNIDPKQVQRDSKTGMAYIMQLNPANGSLVKMDLGVPYEDIVPDYKEPFDPKRYNYFIGENGNAWKMDLKNPDKIEDVGVPYKNFEVLNGIQLEKLDMAKEKFPLEMQLLQSKIGNMISQINNRGKNGKGDGTVSDDDLMILDPNNNPMGVEYRVDDKTGNQVAYIAGTDIPAQVINDEITKLYGNKKDFKKGVGSLNFQGFQVVSGQKWKNSRREFYNDYKQKLLDGSMTPQSLGDIVNFDFKNGVISNAEYNYIKANLTGQK